MGKVLKFFGRALASALVMLLAGGSFAQSPSNGKAPKKPGPKKLTVSTLRLDSKSFQKGKMMPDQFTCRGGNISPELSWKGVPPRTKSFALICEDPDAPTQTWVHWVIYNIPANVFELLENFPRDEKMANGILQGTNDFKNLGYDGPCPPSGTHRYYFKLYAFDSFVPLAAGAGKDQLLKAMRAHQVGYTQIMGLYKR